MPLILTTALSAPLLATEAVDKAVASVPAFPRGGRMMECRMQEQVTVNVNYNFKAKSFSDAKKMFDEQNAKVAELAKQQKLTKFDLQNQNYNIYSNPTSYTPDGLPQDYTYQVNGSSAYRMENAEAAFKFAEFLSQQKIQVGLNSNSYNSGNCN
jgi:uncharacterized protein YggE